MNDPEFDEHMRELIGELRADIRNMREDVVEARAAAKQAKDVAESTDRKLDAMRNRGYGFLAGVTMAAGAAGATIKSVFFGN